MAIGDGVSALATLGVTFGGFSPTAMDGVEASKKYIEMITAINVERKETKRRLRELEFARTSKPKTYTDDRGSQWTYVVVDEKLVRITSCKSTVKTLIIPESIEGYPVYDIAEDACSRNDLTEEIVCPDTLESIGSCVFRYCQELRRVVFPKLVSTYSASWVSHCPNLEEIVLPDRLETITLSIFDNPSIKKLTIGSRARVIDPGAFQKSQLEEVVIHEDNPFIFTDGVGIYSIDGKTLYCIARPIGSYAVINGCERIAKKAAYNIESLERVKLPDSVLELEEFAFSHSGIRDFIAPTALERVSEKAFYYCDKLERVYLNEGLKSVGNSAFEESGLKALRYPSSIESIGRSVTYHTPIVHSGPQCTLTIDDDCKLLFLDGNGGLYRHDVDGAHLIQLVDPDLEEFSVQEGTSVIDEYAFAYNNVIRRVHVSTGVREIKRSAFRCCSRLEYVELPDSVVSIGEEAFLDTELVSFRVPEQLEVLEARAIVTGGAHHGDQMPSLTTIEVAPGNKRFYMASGMLCRRVGEKSNVVLFSNSESTVIFPEEIELIESYAFNNARGIRYLELNPGLRLIETMGLTTWCWIELIHIELSEPVEGRTVFDFRFPNTAKGVQGISMGIGGASWVNVPGIMAQYDNVLINAHNYNSLRTTDSIPIYDQVRKIIERLEDPILLSNVNRGMFERLLRNYIVDICVDVARHDDRIVISKLVEMGFVNADNLEEIIAAVGRLQDAAMTAYLLELKRRRFNQQIFDFDL